MSGFGLAAKALSAAVPLTRAVPGFSAGHLYGIAILNYADTLTKIGKAVDALDRLASRTDQAADEMVRLMRERAPVDTGALRSNIEWHREGNEIVIEANAGELDTYYWYFIEFGTEHMDAQPFFFETIREVLDRYHREITAGADLIPSQVGLT